MIDTIKSSKIASDTKPLDPKLYGSVDIKDFSSTDAENDIVKRVKDRESAMGIRMTDIRSDWILDRQQYDAKWV
jgi:hypothetical protein